MNQPQALANRGAGPSTAALGNPFLQPLTQPATQARLLFQRGYGAEPHGVVRAPGRVNLIGEHTDYNDGFVLPCALDFNAAVAWRIRSDRRVRMCALGFAEEPLELDLDEGLERGEPVQWHDYVKAMLWVWQAQGRPLQGLDLAIAGNVPQGAGLSSSAALEVALGVALREAMTSAVDSTSIALMAQRAENEFVGCRCGNMDQLISAHGRLAHALLIDCRTLDLRPVPMPQEAAVVVIDSKVQRGLVDSEYNLRRQQCETAARHFGVAALRDVDRARLEAGREGLDPVAWRRARHVVTENERTVAAAQALADGDLRAMGQLMAQSHRSMRDDFEITVEPIDRIVSLVAEVVGEDGGVRMTGGGFGGCVVALVPHDRVQAVRDRLERDYRSPQGLAALVHDCRAAGGATAVLG